VVEQRRPDEIAVLVALKAETATVDDQFGAVLDALVDPAFDAGLVGAGDDRAVVGTTGRAMQRSPAEPKAAPDRSLTT